MIGLLVWTRTLREPTRPSVHLNNKLASWIWLDQNLSRGEETLELGKSLFSFWGPGERDCGGREFGQGRCHSDEVSDEPAVEITEA